MKLIAVTPGDPNGIGPEILIKILKKKGTPKGCQLIVFGAKEPFVKSHSVSLFDFSSFQDWNQKKPLFIPIPAPEIRTKGFSAAGFQSGFAVEFATRFILEGGARALVTGPISKENINLGGYKFDGHTELLAEISETPKVTMMLANDLLRVSLVTTHTSLSSVSKKITKKAVFETLSQTYFYLKDRLKLAHPRIAVLGLNPHNGENGLFGNEESKIIIPAVKTAQAAFKMARVTGPFPADTFFAVNHMKKKEERVDAVVCMYHDQALIPVKLLDFKNTVNVTLGLPFIRTSVDHGVGFDIVGKKIADPSSFQAALNLAAALSF